jgi:hypothetical protein
MPASAKCLAWRDRTSDWRNQNPLVIQRLQWHVKNAKWQLFPNKEAAPAVAALCIGSDEADRHRGRARRSLIGRFEGDAAGTNGGACRSLTGRPPLTPGGEQVSNSWWQRA